MTPYPGTAFFERMRPQIEDADLSHYTVYTPVLKYQHLTRQRMEQLVAKCFHRYYFRLVVRLARTRRCCGRRCGSWGLGRGRAALFRPPQPRPVRAPSHIGVEEDACRQRRPPTVRIAAARPSRRCCNLPAARLHSLSCG